MPIRHARARERGADVSRASVLRDRLEGPEPPGALRPRGVGVGAGAATRTAVEVHARAELQEPRLRPPAPARPSHSSFSRPTYLFSLFVLPSPTTKRRVDKNERRDKMGPRGGEKFGREGAGREEKVREA